MSSEEDNQTELPSLSSSLLGRVKQMQPDAWARLVDAFSPIVYRWARQAGLEGADSADVVQDVFVSVAGNISRFERQKQVGSFRSWLATITRNRIKDHYRLRSQIATGQGGTEALQQFQNMPENNGNELTDAQLEQSISLRSLDRRLPVRVLEIVKSECGQKTWQAFWLTTVMGDSAADVAARLEINVESVYQAKSRILRRLRKRMDELP